MSDVLVLGSTGLIGGTFLQLIRNDPAFPTVAAVARRTVDFGNASNIRPVVIDFERLDAHRSALAAPAAFCALGTTIKKAGTRENFRRVDYDIPLAIARIALENGCRRFIVVSAVGADPDSNVFYNRVKGELETALRALPFESLHILRPSLLMGRRAEHRPGESFAKVLVRPFIPVIPAKYRPIHAAAVAGKAIHLLKAPSAGVHIHEGAALRHNCAQCGGGVVGADIDTQ